MKYLLTLAVLLLLSAGLKAQELGGTNSDDNDGCAIVVEKECATGAGLNTTFMKKHQDEFRVSALVMMRNNPNGNIKLAGDDDTCDESTGGCHSNTFIWGAISVVAGLIAFTGIKK